MRCAACDSAAVMSREDVLPRWLHGGLRTASRADGSTRVQPLRARLDLRARIWANAVCRPCNNGWMSRLETAVQPALEPLILGPSRQGSIEDATILATWATKTSLIVELAAGL